MFDVGLGEMAVLLVLALLVFGPDRLPQVVAQVTHWLRQLREQAASARADLVDAVDLDSTGLKDLAELHPKRIAASVLAPVDDLKREVEAAAGTVKGAVDDVGATVRAPAAGGATGAVPPASPATAPAPVFDPDAT